MKRELPKVIKPCLSCSHRRLKSVNLEPRNNVPYWQVVWGCVMKHITFGTDRVAHEAMPLTCDLKS